MNLCAESLIFNPDSGSEQAHPEPGIIHAVNADNSRLDQAGPCPDQPVSPIIHARQRRFWKK